jgi:uncharacterized protein (DUF433 family)
MLHVDDPFRTGKAYTVAQAARLARTTPQTVRRWLLGYDVPGHHMDPVFGSREHDSTTNLQVSFLELVEIAVAARFRNLDKVQLARIRRAHAFARRRLNVPFPFASLDFKVLGGHLVHDFEVEEPERASGPMAFDTDGQWALPLIIQEELESIDYLDDHLAGRWFPFGRGAHIIVDPHYAAGRPVIEGTRIPIQTLRQRWDAGDNLRTLAHDYGLTISVVEEAIRLAA